MTQRQRKTRNAERGRESEGGRRMERGGEREGGRRRKRCTAMQTPFGVSRSARAPAVHVLAVCVDLQASTRHPIRTKAKYTIVSSSHNL